MVVKKAFLGIAACVIVAACQPTPEPVPVAAIPPPPPPPAPQVIQDQPIPSYPSHRHRGRHYYAHGHRHYVHHTNVNSARLHRHVTPHHSGAVSMPPGSVPATSPTNSPLPK